MLSRIRFHIFKFFRPVMRGRYRRPDGRRLPRTRISNTTFLGNPERFDVSDNVFIGHFNFIDASHGIQLEEGCQVTNFVSILTHSSHQAIRLYGKAYGSDQNPKGYLQGPVKIGAYTFIGPHVVIMPNTTIGKGSIVSAYSYVAGHFPDYAIIAGNPARRVGDTREKDAPFLEKDPVLKAHYDEWNNRL